jgi:hypothetical protein
MIYYNTNLVKGDQDMAEEKKGWVKFEGTAKFFVPEHISNINQSHPPVQELIKVPIGLCGTSICHEIYGKCFGAKCPIGKLLIDKKKQGRGIINIPKLTAEEVRFRNITFSLVGLSPELIFPDSIQWLEIHNDELWILAQKDRFYKKEFRPKRREQYGENNYLIFPLPQFYKKRRWKTYEDFVDFLSNFSFFTCLQAKNCPQTDCSLCNQYSCWLTPELCPQNKKSGSYACRFCFYYRKGRPVKIISAQLSG